MTTIKARKPTGTVPWPLVLIEGPEKSGKSYAAAQFTASEKIGQAYWLDIGEGAADEYAAIEGANYLVIEHDGTWADMLGQVQAVHDEAARAAKAGEKPIVLVIDSMTAEWDLLKDWTSHRARQSKAGKRTLAADPDAEVKPAMNLWNDANARHGALMHLLMTFPGIAIVTARGKEVASLDDGGKPIVGQKDYRVEGHKALAFDATAWVRLSRDSHPKVVGVRSIHAGIQPGVDRPVARPNFSVEWLVFDLMKCNPNATHVRDHVQTKAADPVASEPEPDYVAVEEWTATADSIDALRSEWRRMNAVKTDRAAEVCELIAARVKTLQEPQPEPSHEEAKATLADALNAEVVTA